MERTPPRNIRHDATHRRVVALLAAAATALLSAISGPAVAGDKPQGIPARSGDDIAEIKAIVKHHRLALSDSFLEKSQGYPDIVKFCETFLDDLKAERVEYVKPALTTDGPSHPELKRYRTCQKYEHTLEQRGKPDFVYHDLSDIGTTRFRLYRLELDGNPANGPEEVIYGEKEHTSPPFGQYGPTTSMRGSYAQLDPKACMLTYYNLQVLRSEFDGTKDGRSALIRYLGVPYVIAFWRREPKSELKYWRPDYIADLWGSEHSPGLHNVQRCSIVFKKR